MISIDSNVIQSALNPHDVNHTRALNALNAHATQPFCISPFVRTELRASGSWLAIAAWCKAQSVSVIWDMPEQAWDNAGIAFGRYAAMRRSGQVPRRIVADFLIASHAEHHNLEVMTFDDTVYKAVFSSLTLVQC
jgi:predicted nucleic acid-binding protein